MSVHIDPEQTKELTGLKQDIAPLAVKATVGTGTAFLGIAVGEWVSILAAIYTLCNIIKFLVEHRKGIAIFFKSIWGWLTCFRK